METNRKNMKKFEIHGIAMIDGFWKDVKVCDTVFNTRAEARKHLKDDDLVWLYYTVMNPYIIESKQFPKSRILDMMFM